MRAGIGIVLVCLATLSAATSHPANDPQQSMLNRRVYGETSSAAYNAVAHEMGNHRLEAHAVHDVHGNPYFIQAQSKEHGSFRFARWTPHEDVTVHLPPLRQQYLGHGLIAATQRAHPASHHTFINKMPHENLEHKVLDQHRVNLESAAALMTNPNAHTHQLGAAAHRPINVVESHPANLAEPRPDQISRIGASSSNPVHLDSPKPASTSKMPPWMVNALKNPGGKTGGASSSGTSKLAPWLQKAKEELAAKEAAEQAAAAAKKAEEKATATSSSSASSTGKKRSRTNSPEDAPAAQRTRTSSPPTAQERRGLSAQPELLKRTVEPVDQDEYAGSFLEARSKWDVARNWFKTDFKEQPITGTAPLGGAVRLKENQRWAVLVQHPNLQVKHEWVGGKYRKFNGLPYHGTGEETGHSIKEESAKALAEGKKVTKFPYDTQNRYPPLHQMAFQEKMVLRIAKAKATGGKVSTKLDRPKPAGDS
ncbi:hypothetical protein IE81DRAFT_350550 [Ceraceosorus guamensis]|uniref:Uncharacterized protein n=1 Tax=Ceraceosorus guamensis TaxID=1522189 RepID=A0A316VU27_9BASI|nr:hypothetical protein IE81DRAFT_350550 [Ceraceosorus guamensis]PWN39015.1 hypothetical protein IE81DRAFT_350550 [Ceraceosorus guamensis]